MGTHTRIEAVSGGEATWSRPKWRVRLREWVWEWLSRGQGEVGCGEEGEAWWVLRGNLQSSECGEKCEVLFGDGKRKREEEEGENEEDEENMRAVNDWDTCRHRSWALLNIIYGTLTLRLPTRTKVRE